MQVQHSYKTRQPMVEFYLLTFPRFPLRKKEHKSYFGKNRTHDFRTSRCAGYLLDHSGDDAMCRLGWVSWEGFNTFVVSPCPVSFVGKHNLQLYLITTQPCTTVHKLETILCLTFGIVCVNSEVNVKISYRSTSKSKGYKLNDD